MLGAVLIAGCGRIGFDPVGETGDDGSGDGSTVALGPCPRPDVIPDPVTITGRTIRVTAFGTVEAEDAVTVRALDRIGGVELAQTVSDGNGDYVLAVPSGGKPVASVLTLTKTGLLISTFVPEAPIDRHTILQSPMGSMVATDSLYSAGGANRDSMMGTLLIQVRDCDAGDLTGATVAITPAPEKIIYANGLCAPNQSQSMTRSPCPYAWALNVPPGLVRITTTKAGVTFLPYEVEIQPGNYFMGTVVHAVP